MENKTREEVEKAADYRKEIINIIGLDIGDGVDKLIELFKEWHNKLCQPVEDEDKEGSFSWFVQDIDLILDFAISDKQKLKMIEDKTSAAYGRIVIKKKDPFIEKHLDTIWQKTKEAKIKMYIEPMYATLRAASIKYFLETGTVNGGFDQALNDLMDSIRNWKPAQPVENKSAVWVKASERLGEFEDSDIPYWKFWHPGWCKVDGKPAERPFFRKDTEKKTINFSYISIPGSQFSEEIPENDFHRIEWLDENSGASQPTIDSIRVQAAKDRHRLIEVEKVIDMYQEAKDKSGKPFMWYEREDILRAVQNLLERKVVESA